MRARAFFAVALALLAGSCAPPGSSVDDDIPVLRAQGDATQLIVDGAPFLMLAGELGNSTASDLSYLNQYWTLFDQLHMNTVLAPVSWELIEPDEGQFDFTSVDGLINAARTHDKRLVLLWFGAWKNSMSSYAPAWVKRDQARFPRAQTSDGRGIEILSPFSDENRNADARAFAALMTHLRDYDAAQNTVIMVQVENEIGMIPQARDHSAAANAAFAGPVSLELTSYLSAHQNKLAPSLRTLWEANGARTQGSWSEVFGASAAAEEVFMAWSFATYVEALARAGKEAHPLPLFVNAALNRPGRAPGEYPSAGPLPHLFAVWRAGAPSIDLLAPDIYFPNFTHWAQAYAHPGNPLFVPETGRAPQATPANAFYAFGAHDAIGFSPFAIEQYAPNDRLASAYEILSELSPIILQHQGGEAMIGFRPPVDHNGSVDAAPQTHTLGDYNFHVSFEEMFRPSDQQNPLAHGGLIIHLGENEFLIAGSGLTITFSAEGESVGIESAWEGRFVDGEWRRGRLLNGDETHQGRHVRFSTENFSIQRVRLYRYH